MANADEKAAITNIALLAVGQKLITLLTDGTPHVNKIAAIFEDIVKELLSKDWIFSRRRIHTDDMTAINKLTVDTAPTVAVWAVGATLTGATSLKTCVVVARLNDTTYLVTEPSGDFTDGEIISDGVNSVDCATGYPVVDEALDIGGNDYGYLMPTDQLFIRGLGAANYDDVKYRYHREGKIIFTNYYDCYWHYNRWMGEAESTTVSDVTIMPNWFHRLISARLADILSPNITENQRVRSKVSYELEAAWLFAREANGDETFNENEQGNTDWRDGANNELQALG